jgi:hypothetical protein
MIGKDGQPRQQLVLTGIVVSAQGAVTGPQGQKRPVGIGEMVDTYLHGHAWGAYIEAEKAARTAGIEPQVGDVVLVHWTHTEPSSQPGAQDKRVKNIVIRRARPDEQHWVQQAEAAYYGLGFDKPDVPAAPAQPGPFDTPAPSMYGQQPAPAYPAQQQPQYAPQQPQYPSQQTGPGF